MKESIVCIGRIGEKPYRFKDTGIEIFSYEELCYYLSQHMLCYLYTLPDEDILEYLRTELGLEKLARQLQKLNNPDKDQMKYFAALFREGHYFGEDEIRDILDAYRAMKNASYSRQCKWMGDMLMKHQREGRAILYYTEALNKDAGEASEAGKIYHNLGVAQARLFRYQDAKISFLKAYQRAEDENSLFYYYVMSTFDDGVGKSSEELKLLEISDLMIETFENRLGEFMDSFRFTDAAEKYKRWSFLMENGRDDEAKSSLKAYVRKMQTGFRRKLEAGQPLASPDVPMVKE